MKILINTPSLKLMGGVASHYKGLRAFWTENVMYNTIGKRNATKCGSGKYWLLWDCLKFIFRLLTFRPDVVLTRVRDKDCVKNRVKRAKIVRFTLC